MKSRTWWYVLAYLHAPLLLFNYNHLQCFVLVCYSPSVEVIIFLSPAVFLQNMWFIFWKFSNMSLIHLKFLLVLLVPPPMFHEHEDYPPLQYWLNYHAPWFILILKHVPYSICILEHASSVTHFKVHPLITLNSFKHIPCYLLVHYVPGWNY